MSAARDDEFEPNQQGGYTQALGSGALASRCCFCGRELLDAPSIEAGYGPICAEKYMLPHGDGGSPDMAALQAALEIAPDKLRQALADVVASENSRAIVNKAVWHASMAVSYPDQEKNAVIAVCQRIALACGFSHVSERLLVFYFKSAAPIKLMRVPPNHIGVCTPYNDAFVSAIRGVPGRRWDGASKCNVVPESSLLHALAVLSACFPGLMMQDADGNMVPVPRDVQVPPPQTKPAGAPTKATGESGLAPVPIELKKGDRVTDPRGREKYVCWISASKDNQRVGLGDSPTQRGGFEFYGFSEVKLKPASEVVKEEAKRQDAQAKEATVQGAPPPPPSAAPVRDVPKDAFPHQVEGVAWLDRVRTGLLASEPGLGKTLMACVAADPRVLVVCPAAMRIEWSREMNRWRSDLGVLIVSGTKPYSQDKYEEVQVIVVNYDILPYHLEALKAVEIKTLVADEAHYLKTIKQSGRKRELSGSKRALAFAELAERVTHKKFLLTATPIMNRPIELWPILFLIDPARWDSYTDFGKRFCNGKLEEKVIRGGRRVTTWNFTGSSNEAELNAILRSRYMLRHTKDILNLPPKSRQTLVIALDDKTAKEYSVAARDFEKWVGTNGGPAAVMKHLKAPAITKMTALRHLVAIGKIEYAVEWIVQHAEGTGRPLVVMAHHRDVTEGLIKKLSELEFDSSQGKRRFRVGKIIGGMEEAKRTADKDAFQRGELDVIICSISAAGVGLTLTAATETLFVERDYVPAKLVQAEDRVWRIGTLNKVTITYLDAHGTVDQVIGAMLVDKASVEAEVVQGLNLNQEEAEAWIFGEMFKMVKGGATQNPGQRMLPLIDWQAAEV